MPLKFSIKKYDGNARTGIGKIHGKKFETPAFLPVATLGCVRGLDSRDLKNIGVDIIIANTLHLHTSPGDELIKELGGLHEFMNYDGVIVTDSGGFQAFSLGSGMEHKVGKIANNIFLEGLKEIPEEPGERWTHISEKGILYRNPIKGIKMWLTPEISAKIQENLDSDIVYVLDECTSPLASKNYTKEAMERTHRWIERFLHVFSGKQGIFGIVQGGEYKDLREVSARFVADKPFDGFGIGGSLGKSKQDMLNILDWVIPLLPEEKPRHLLGIGGIEDIFNCVEKGIDMFDCVTPTRWARRGMLFISPESGGNQKNKFMLKIRSTQFMKDDSTLDTWCKCYVCREHTKAYLRHLYKSERLNFWRMASYHNVHFIIQLMGEIRERIKEGDFHRLKREWIGQ